MTLRLISFYNTILNMLVPIYESKFAGFYPEYEKLNLAFIKNIAGVSTN